MYRSIFAPCDTASSTDSDGDVYDDDDDSNIASPSSTSPDVTSCTGQHCHLELTLSPTRTLITSVPGSGNRLIEVRACSSN